MADSDRGKLRPNFVLYLLTRPCTGSLEMGFVELVNQQQFAGMSLG